MTIQIARDETHCHHYLGHSFWLAENNLIYPPSPQYDAWIVTIHYKHHQGNVSNPSVQVNTISTTSSIYSWANRIGTSWWFPVSDTFSKSQRHIVTWGESSGAHLLWWINFITLKLMSNAERKEGRKEGNVLFKDALNTFNLRLYEVRHMVKDHTDSERGNLLLSSSATLSD